jgi:hypothetical protein
LKIVDIVLNNKIELTTPTNFWSPLLDRLNFVCIAIHCTLFENPIDPEKDKKMNKLWRIFFENFKLINLQVRNKRLDPNKVSLSQEKNLKKHKEFFMFWFKKLIPKMGPDTDLERVIKFLQENFQRIYGKNHVYWLLRLSKQIKIDIPTHQKNHDRLSESVNLKSTKISTNEKHNSFDIIDNSNTKRRMSLRRMNEDVIQKEENPQVESEKVDSSMIVSKSILNKFQTPVKANLKMVKEEQSISTDSEIEEFQKSVNKFKSKKPHHSGQQRYIGENLSFNKTEVNVPFSK